MAKTRSRVRNSRKRRCLIVERHQWETGGGQQQLQFVLDTAREFFGPGDGDRVIQVRVFLPSNAPDPAYPKQVTISREYRNGTRRVNGFPEMGAVPPSFVFFEEAAEENVYDVWWLSDKAIVAAVFRGWQQGRNTQHGRGRLSVIVRAPVERVIERID
jgi:hypothetical protein